MRVSDRKVSEGGGKDKESMEVEYVYSEQMIGIEIYTKKNRLLLFSLY